MKIGIALGGGGIRGIAHLGVLKAIYDAGKKHLMPTIIAGTSVGALVGALYASGMEIDLLIKAAKKINWFKDIIDIRSTLFHLLSSVKNGIISNERVRSFVNEKISQKKFDELPFDLAIIATEIEKRERIIFTTKKIKSQLNYNHLTKIKDDATHNIPKFYDRIITDIDDVGLAVQASTTLPGVFKYMMLDKLKIVDGGMVNQVPVDICRAMGADIVIGVSLGMTDFCYNIKNSFEAFSNMIDILAVHEIQTSLSHADIGFQVKNIEEKSIFHTSDIEGLINMGKNAMQPYIKKLIRLSKPFFLF